jgi:serine O-acetyltransferase
MLDRPELGIDGVVHSQHAGPRTEISATVPDWSREAKAIFEWSPSRSLLASIRAYQRHKATGGLVGGLLRNVAVLRHRFWAAVTGCDIPVNTRIGGGLLIPHPNGIVVHPDTEIGPNCLLLQQVTLGRRRAGAPVLGGHVDVGAGAKVLGPIRLGDHCKVGANAVVLDDVPSGVTAVGVPAMLVTKKNTER